MATITYAGPAQFLTSLTWREVQPSLLAQSPLRSLHWKSAAPSRSSIRTIQHVHVDIVPLDSVREEHTSQIPTTILDKPLLNIYIFACEETDAETYRTTFKRLIKDWHSSITSKKNQEWLIVQVIRSDTRAQSGKLFQLKGRLNTDKRERCVQLNWSSGNNTPIVWAELTQKLKEGLILAEDEVKRSESQRSMPGWNFCNFFILKESLASSFLGFGLFEDALIQYEELEVSFFQVMKDKNMSWFGVLITPSPQDASAPLLSLSKKPYRDLILANNISVFDFRIYILARQCEILAEMGRVNDICSKAAGFLEAFGRRLREAEASLPAFFIEYWRYSSALSVVDHCDSYTSQNYAAKSDPTFAAAGKGELLELARHQLDVIGVKQGHLPRIPPFSTDPTDTSFDHIQTTDSKDSVANASFTESITDKDRFYELYTATTNRAIKSYADGGRKKFALKLHGSLAALESHCGHLSNALTTFSQLPTHYQSHAWLGLESFMYSRALETHDSIGKDKDRNWITTVLSFLKTYVNDFTVDFMLSEEDGRKKVSSLISELHIAARALDTDLPYPDHPMVTVEVTKTAIVAEDMDGTSLDVTLDNHLPCPLPIDQVQVVLAGPGAERLRYSLPSDPLLPGKTTLRLHCPDPLHGTYILEATEARMSKLLFQWLHWKPSLKLKKHGKAKPTLIQVPQDPLSLDVQIRPPRNMEIGRDKGVVVILSTGRNSVIKSVLRLTSTSTRFKYDSIEVHEGSQGNARASDDGITIENVPSYGSITFSLKHADVSVNVLTMSIDISYTTIKHPDLERKLLTTRKVPIGMPISLFVEDFFSGEKLFSKFTISTTTSQHVRMSAADLSPPPDSGVQIVPCSMDGRILSITPSQPAVFLFMTVSEGGPPPDSLYLRVTFRMLREEIEYRINKAVEAVIPDPLAVRERTSLTEKIVSALEKDNGWIHLYAQTNELHIPQKALDAMVNSHAAEVSKLLLSPPPPDSGPWRTIIMPVDVPQMQIVASVSLDIMATPFASRGAEDELPPLYAGEPISAILRVHASFHWGGSLGESDRKYRIRYDVQEMVQDWLISGRKRGDIWIQASIYKPVDGQTATAPVTLVALHHGRLLLPQVAIKSLPVAGAERTMGSLAIPSTFTYQSHAAEKVTVLPRAGRSTFIVDLGE
ncbi:trafficking protein particle complex subunit 10 [Flagelloscypha sp. PMI_526]|nr:trafficking protein particle complex subunit 10 [Flagelloscypha sp. PMI_526]